MIYCISFELLKNSYDIILCLYLNFQVIFVPAHSLRAN